MRTATCDLQIGDFNNTLLPAPATLSEIDRRPAPAAAPLLKDRYLRLDNPAALGIRRYRHLRHFWLPTGDRHLRRHLYLRTATCDFGNRRLSFKTATCDMQTGDKSHRRVTKSPVTAPAIRGMLERDIYKPLRAFLFYFGFPLLNDLIWNRI